MDAILNASTDVVRALLAQAMPQGEIWRTDEVEQLLDAIAPALAAALRTAGRTLLDESDPATATATLAMWARVFGLPRCTQLPTAIEELRALVSSQGTHGGRHPLNYRRMAAELLSWPLDYVRVIRYGPFVAGSRCGTPCYGEQYRAVWKLLVYGWDLGAPAVCGVVRAGDPLVSDWRNPALECMLRALAPAQTVAFVGYTDVIPA